MTCGHCGKKVEMGATICAWCHKENPAFSGSPIILMANLFGGVIFLILLGAVAYAILF